MTDQPAQRFHTARHKEAHLLEFFLPANIEAIEFDAINDELAIVIASGPGKKWIVDLSHADYFGSALLGMLVNIRSKVRSIKGQLVLCHLSVDLSRVIHASSMERLFTIVETKDEA